MNASEWRVALGIAIAALAVNGVWFALRLMLDRSARKNQ